MIDIKDIVAEANEIRELEGYVGLFGDSQVIHKRLWEGERERERERERQRERDREQC